MKFRCECGWHGTEPLTAPSPFDPTDRLIACPECKSGEGLTDACGVEGCWEGPTTNGGPNALAGGEYIQACSKHGFWRKSIRSTTIER